MKTNASAKVKKITPEIASGLQPKCSCRVRCIPWFWRNNDGTWLAMTFTKSKTFKTRAGAARWFAKWTGQ